MPTAAPQTLHTLARRGRLILRSHAVTLISGVLCFGLVGLLIGVPALRRRWVRTAALCVRCRRNQSVLRLLIATAALLLLSAAIARVAVAADPPLLCNSSIEADGSVRSEPLLQLASSGDAVWNAVRPVLVAPASGLALIGTRIAGMRECSGPPLVVTFRWPASARGGSMIGDVFVTWEQRIDQPSSVLNEQLISMAASARTTRFGPNIAADRAEAERLGAHETRHADQWAIATLVAGPAAFPIAYGGDYLVFPYERSHFERAAGLEDGAYPTTGGTGPAPLWGPLTATIVVLLLLLRHRIRWCWRRVRWSRARRASTGDRCLRHARPSTQRVRGTPADGRQRRRAPPPAAPHG